jgi:hypothetical protein
MEQILACVLARSFLYCIFRGLSPCRLRGESLLLGMDVAVPQAHNPLGDAAGSGEQEMP